MFRTVLSNLAINVKNKIRRGIFTIPDGAEIITAYKLFCMLEWIYKEFLKDSEDNKEFFTSDGLGKDPVNWEAFATRNTSRVLSYITQLFVLETILIKTYQHTAGLLKTRIDPTVIMDVEELKKRAQEIEPLEFIRNKVAAHTAFSSPRKDDNLATEFDSLMAILNTSFEPDKIYSFRIGAGQVVLGGVTAPRKIPEIGLQDIHSTVIEHFQAWEGMFVKILSSVKNKLPIENEEWQIK